MRGGGGLQLLGALWFAQVGQPGLPTEERRFQQRTPFGRNHHAHAVGNGDQLRLAFAALLHIGAPPSIVGGDDLVFEAEFHCQFARPGLFRHPGVGTALDHETLAMNRFDDAAQPP